MLPLLSYDILNLIVQKYLSDFDVLRGLGITSSDFRRYAKGYTTKRPYSLCSVMDTTSDVKFVDVYADTFYLDDLYHSNHEKYIEKMKHCTAFTFWMCYDFFTPTTFVSQWIPKSIKVLRIDSRFRSMSEYVKGMITEFVKGIPDTIEEIVFINQGIYQYILPKSIKKISFVGDVCVMKFHIPDHVTELQFDTCMHLDLFGVIKPHIKILHLQHYSGYIHVPDTLEEVHFKEYPNNWTGGVNVSKHSIKYFCNGIQLQTNIVDNNVNENPAKKQRVE
jgi:hypothetical protein